MEITPWLPISTGSTSDINSYKILQDTAATREMWNGNPDWSLLYNTSTKPDTSRPTRRLEATEIVRSSPPQNHLGQLATGRSQVIAVMPRTKKYLTMAQTLLAAHRAVDFPASTGSPRDLLGHAVWIIVASANSLTPALADTLLPL